MSDVAWCCLSLYFPLRTSLSWNVGPGAEKLFVTKLRAAVPAAEWCEMRPGPGHSLGTGGARYKIGRAEGTQY